MNDTLIYNTSTPKRSVNLSMQLQNQPVRPTETRDNLKTNRKKRAEWLKENRESLEAYNQRIEERSVFSDDLRTF